MSTERTLSIIKPDATARNITGHIIAKLEGRRIGGRLGQGKIGNFQRRFRIAAGVAIRVRGGLDGEGEGLVDGLVEQQG